MQELKPTPDKDEFWRVVKKFCILLPFSEGPILPFPSCKVFPCTVSDFPKVATWSLQKTGDGASKLLYERLRYENCKFEVNFQALMIVWKMIFPKHLGLCLCSVLLLCEPNVGDCVKNPKLFDLAFKSRIQFRSCWRLRYCYLVSQFAASKLVGLESDTQNVPRIKWFFFRRNVSSESNTPK